MVARVDGTARVLDPATAEARAAIALLIDRYEQYRDHAPEETVVAVDVERWTGWSAAR